ncbi:MAG: TOMM precursor leader peptide-binding protein [Pseudomonadota bacterium]
MNQFPTIKAKYQVIPIRDEGVYLLAENEKHVLEGAVMPHLIGLLDGQKTWEAILAQLGPSFGEEAVRQAINVVLTNNHVETAAPAAMRPFQIYWSELGLDWPAAAQLMEHSNIHVIPVGMVNAQIVLQGLASMGLKSDAARPATMSIVVTEDYEHPALGQINQAFHERGAPWLLMKPSGLIPLVGPLIRPRETACWECLVFWMRHNREVESYVSRKAGGAGPLMTSKARVPLGESQSASFALLQLARYLATGQAAYIQSRITAFDTLTGDQSTHPVNRRPQCPICGDPALAHVAGKPLELKDPQERVENENGFRPEHPDTTFHKYAHLISPLTGIVKGIYPTQVQNTSLIKTYVAGHNFALKSDGLIFLKDGLRSNSSGKGRTDAQARTSALCEALERYSGTYRREEETRRATLKSLGDEAVDPRLSMLYSEKQYEDRAEWNAKHARFQVVPDPFDENAELTWAPVWSHTQKRRKWMPASALYYGFSERDHRFYAWSDSNGAAAGGNLEDALLQGALELVERDCVGIWWMNMLSRPGLDLESFGDQYVLDLKSYFTSIGRDLWVLDLTSDLGIPTFAAINRRRDGPTEDIVMGFGAHLDPRIALSRCVTEMNQFIPAVLKINEEGVTQYGYDDPEALDWWRNATLENQPYLGPSCDLPATRLCDFEGPLEGSVRENVERVFAGFEAAGCEVLIHDQTRPDIGLPVVKVIAPGMRHFWARYAPGRLYDVPVKMGWLKTPTAESDLNPIAMFI